MKQCTLLLMLTNIPFRHNGLVSSITTEKCIAAPASYALSNIVGNYLSKYFHKSDMFVKIWMSSTAFDLAHHQFNIVDTIIQNERLSNFTFELTTNIVEAKERRLMCDRSPTIERAPFDLFIVDSIESFK